MNDFERIHAALFEGTITAGALSVVYSHERGKKPIPHFLGWGFENGGKNRINISQEDCPLPDTWTFINPLASQETVTNELRLLETEMSDVASTGKQPLFLTVENGRMNYLIGKLSVDLQWPRYMGVKEVIGEDGFFNPFPLQGRNILVACMKSTGNRRVSSLIRPIRNAVEKRGLHSGFVTTPRGYHPYRIKDGVAHVGNPTTNMNLVERAKPV